MASIASLSPRERSLAASPAGTPKAAPRVGSLAASSASLSPLAASPAGTPKASPRVGSLARSPAGTPKASRMPLHVGKARTAVAQIGRLYEEGAGFSDVAIWLMVVLNQIFLGDTPQKKALLSAVDCVSDELQQSGERSEPSSTTGLAPRCRAELRSGESATELLGVASLRLKFHRTVAAATQAGAELDDDLLKQVEDVLVNIPLQILRGEAVTWPTPSGVGGLQELCISPAVSPSGVPSRSPSRAPSRPGPRTPNGEGLERGAVEAEDGTEQAEASTSAQLRRALSRHQEQLQQAQPRRGGAPRPSKEVKVKRQLVMDSDREGDSGGGTDSEADGDGPAPEPAASGSRAAAPGGAGLRAAAAAAAPREAAYGGSRGSARAGSPGARLGSAAFSMRVGASAPGSLSASLVLPAAPDAQPAAPPRSAPGCARRRPAADGGGSGIEAVVAARQARAHAQARGLLTPRGGGRPPTSGGSPVLPGLAAPGGPPHAFGARLSATGHSPWQDQEGLAMHEAGPARAAEGRPPGSARGQACAGGPPEPWARRPLSQGLRDSLWRKKIVVVDEHLPRRRGIAGSRSAARAR